MSSKINTIRNNIKKLYADKKRKREELYNRCDKKKDILYQDKRWKKLREAYRALHPLCEICEMEGYVTPQDAIHHLHIISSGETLEEQQALCFDPNNLCSVCRHHHDVFHEYLRHYGLVQCTKDDLFRYDIKKHGFE